MWLDAAFERRSVMADKKNIVTIDRAALFAAFEIHKSVHIQIPGLPALRGARLAEPDTIYDLNGNVLFYDFPVTGLDYEPIGLVRTAASRFIGTPVVSFYPGGIRWDIGRASRKIEKLIVKQKKKASIIKMQPVCYAYPKLGIAVDWKAGPQKDIQRTIFDVSDLSVVPGSVSRNLRGPGVVSTKKIYRAGARSLKLFKKYENILTSLKRKRLKIEKMLDFERFQAVQLAIKVLIPFYITRRLRFCTHGSSHECFRMHGQEDGVWCVVATGQMILDFWRYYNTQNDIATAMGTGTGGTGWNGEVNGLNSLTCNHFTAQSDMNPTFAKVRTEINANRPFDYSYSHHAMACAGYSRQILVPLGLNPVQSVYLYDPWPVNAGTIRWETWGAGNASVAGFVFLRRT